MAKRFKISRNFTFKAYNVNECEEVQKDAHVGNFFFKSECHYYAEKAVLDYLQTNAKDGEHFAIYKVCTLEDTNCKDMLIEQIIVKDGTICIF